MAIRPSHLQYEFSKVREEKVEVGRLHDDGFLFLKDDPGVWIQSNPDIVSSVRSLELYLICYRGERIGNSIGELLQLTHLSIYGGWYLKCLPNTLSRLHNLHHLKLINCIKVAELPPNLGDLYNLTSLYLRNCFHLKSVPKSVAKLSNLTTLFIYDCEKVEELPATLGDLKLLAYLFLFGCDRLNCLSWSITNLSKLKQLYLPKKFRVETLPPHLNESIIISVQDIHVRKTWKELKTHVAEFPIIPEELAAQKTYTPGYLQFKGDPTLWIRDYNNYGLHSSLRILDLDLCTYNIPIPDSIGELPQLTHIYISNGCLPHHLPPTFSRLTHLSLIDYTFKCDTDSHFDCLGNLSTLTSLHLYPRYNRLLPEHMDLPISLTHLTLRLYQFSSIRDNYMASLSKLSNLNTLTLSSSGDLDSLPLNLKITKLILRHSTITSFPIGLKHLEIIHFKAFCINESCNKLQECWKNQLVNLETLSYTCHEIESLSSLTSIHNLQKLQLKDCFSLKELPQDLDKLVNLCTLDVSGTRIQSLPNSIINLHNLRRLILPKCFRLYTLQPDFENKLMISVDDTDESYYKHQGYHAQRYEIINDCDYMTSDFIKEINETFLEKFKQATVIEQASPYRPSNHQPDATRIIEGSLLNGSADPTCNNNHNAFSSSQEVEILPTRNEAARTKPDVVAELFSNAPMDFEVFNTDFFNFPYHNNIPAVIMDNLVGWKDVEADGNCGFRCVAEVFHGGQENWPMARRAILNELKAHPDVYQKIYRDDYDSALKRIDWNDGQCGEDHYMEIVSDLFPIANCHQCPVMCFFVTNDGLNPQLSATVLPWNVGAYNTRPTKELTIAHLGTYKHYILLDLKDDFPVPPIHRRWYEIIDKTVVDWDSPYETRRQSWDLLTNRSRDSSHLDISDGECFSNSSANTRQDYAPMEIEAAGSGFHLHETISSRENSQEASHHERMDHIKLEMGQGIAPYSSINSVDTRSKYPTLENGQDEIARHGKVKKKPQKIEITRESIQLLLPQGMRLEDAAMHLQVSRSTFKRALKNYGITWPSSRKRKLLDSNKSAPHNTISSSGRNLSLLNSVDPADPSIPTGHDHMVVNSDGPNQCLLPYNLPSEHNIVNKSTSNAVMRTVEEPPVSTHCHIDGHQRVEEHSNGAKECTLLNNAVQPHESCSSFVVKATYNNELVRFDFSLSSSMEQLEKEVGKRFKLEVGKFKMYYEDDEKELILIPCISDLGHALRLSKKRGSNIVRLSIKLLEG